MSPHHELRDAASVLLVLAALAVAGIVLAYIHAENRRQQACAWAELRTGETPGAYQPGDCDE